jgi:calcium-activated chloride channel regulator 4
MGSAVTNYIRNYVNNGSFVGMVQFSSVATVLAGMTEILDDDARQTLLDVIPTIADGSTAMGQGLERCAEVNIDIL